jgi:hypothetical protein
MAMQRTVDMEVIFPIKDAASAALMAGCALSGRGAGASFKNVRTLESTHRFSRSLIMGASFLALSCHSCRPNAPFAKPVRLPQMSIADEMHEEHRRRVHPTHDGNDI